MGLAGRKVKQRIGADPRNLTWADDASKFGAAYLAKFGWTSSQGLGASGEGRTSHIKVSQKLDMLGIGAAHSKDPNGIAWKQNKDFENLLKRLNANNEAEPSQESESQPQEDGSEEKEKSDGNESKKEKKKRKREGEKEEKKKKRRKISEEETAMETATETSAPEASAVTKEPSRPVVPRHRAHRARHIAAKSFASKSAAAISEILGISSSSSTTAAPTPTGTLTPLEPEPTLEKLTTSTKSVSDYFKERLLAKYSGKSTPITASTTPSSDDNEERAGLGVSRARDTESDDEDDRPRGGLGSSKIMQSSSLTSTSQIATSKFASMFAAFIPTLQQEPLADTKIQPSEKETSKEEKKKEKRKRKKLEEEGNERAAKEEKRRRKEERRKAKKEKLAKAAKTEEAGETVSASSMVRVI